MKIKKDPAIAGLRDEGFFLLCEGKSPHTSAKSGY